MAAPKREDGAEVGPVEPAGPMDPDKPTRGLLALHTDMAQEINELEDECRKYAEKLLVCRIRIAKLQAARMAAGVG